MAQSVPLTAPESVGSGSSEGTDSGTGRLAFLLLGQEEFKEHHSEITQCKFSGSGCVIGNLKQDLFYQNLQQDLFCQNAPAPAILR